MQRRWCRLSIFVALAMLAASSSLAQRIQSSALHYKGAFRLPEGSDGSNWEYSGYGMTYYTDGDAAAPADGYPGSLFASVTTLISSWRKSASRS